MLCLSRKIDYALIALAYLIEKGGVASAREIAVSNELPLPLVMKILNRLHSNDLITGTRGVKGGYRIELDLNTISLSRLIDAVEDQKPSERRHRHAPVQALHYRLLRFIEDVKLSDLVVPGRRIDVPLELLAAS